MSDLNSNNDRLTELDDAIDKARDELILRAEAFDEAELTLTIKKEKAIFEAKYHEKMPDTTAKAKAIVSCEAEMRAYMMADAQHRRAKIGLEKLIDRKSTLMEQNYNMRAEMKTFGG
jgi:hypothetical protein